MKEGSARDEALTVRGHHTLVHNGIPGAWNTDRVCALSRACVFHRNDASKPRFWSPRGEKFFLARLEACSLWRYDYPSEVIRILRQKKTLRTTSTRSSTSARDIDL